MVSGSKKIVIIIHVTFKYIKYSVQMAYNHITVYLFNCLRKCCNFLLQQVISTYNVIISKKVTNHRPH